MDSPLAVFAVIIAAIWSAATIVLKANDFLTDRRDRIMNLYGGKELNKAEKLLLFNNDYKPTLIGSAIFSLFLLVIILGSAIFLFNLEVSERLFIIGIILLMFITLGYIFFNSALRDYKELVRYIYPPDEKDNSNHLVKPESKLERINKGSG